MHTYSSEWGHKQANGTGQGFRPQLRSANVLNFDPQAKIAIPKDSEAKKSEPTKRTNAVSLERTLAKVGKKLGQGSTKLAETFIENRLRP